MLKALQCFEDSYSYVVSVFPKNVATQCLSKCCELMFIVKTCIAFIVAMPVSFEDTENLHEVAIAIISMSIDSYIIIILSLIIYNNSILS